MANYDIRPLQLRLLQILEKMDKVCKEHNLRYYIIAGTLLGAVRHKGFIPWDDDLDIGMPRKDYEQLIKHSQEWLPQPLELICTENDDNYPFHFGKIQDASTTLIERQHIKYLGGVYIDVFPMDGVPSGWLAKNLHFMRYEYYKRMLYFVFRDPYKHGHGPSSWLPLICQAIYSKKAIQQKMYRLLAGCDYESHNLVAAHGDGRHDIMPKEVYGTPTPIGFEYATVMGPANPHEYLSRRYGEYMVIPDGNHQHQHNFHYMDLNKPYHKYKEK